jgi:acyl carrier protein
MGLDIVELIMRVEEEFDLEIPDEDVEQLITTGMMADYLVQKQEQPLERQEEIWQQLCFVIADQCAVPPEKITRNTRFVEDLNLD